MLLKNNMRIYIIFYIIDAFEINIYDLLSLL